MREVGSMMRAGCRRGCRKVWGQLAVANWRGFGERCSIVRGRTRVPSLLEKRHALSALAPTGHVRPLRNQKANTNSQSCLRAYVLPDPRLCSPAPSINHACAAAQSLTSWSESSQVDRDPRTTRLGAAGQQSGTRRAGTESITNRPPALTQPPQQLRAEQAGLANAARKRQEPTPLMTNS